MLYLGIIAGYQNAWKIACRVNYFMDVQLLQVVESLTKVDMEENLKQFPKEDTQDRS